MRHFLIKQFQKIIQQHERNRHDIISQQTNPHEAAKEGVEKIIKEMKKEKIIKEIKKEGNKK